MIGIILAFPGASVFEFPRFPIMMFHYSRRIGKTVVPNIENADADAIRSRPAGAAAEVQLLG